MNDEMEDIVERVIERWIGPKPWNWKIYKMLDELADVMRDIAAGSIDD